LHYAFNIHVAGLLQLLKARTGLYWQREATVSVHPADMSNGLRSETGLAVTMLPPIA